MKSHLFSMHGQYVPKNLPSKLVFCWQILYLLEYVWWCHFFAVSIMYTLNMYQAICIILYHTSNVVNMLCFFIVFSYILASTVWITAGPQGHRAGGKTFGSSQVNRYSDDLLSSWKFHSYCLLWCLLLILSLTVIFQETDTPTPSGGEEVTSHLCTIKCMTKWLWWCYSVLLCIRNIAILFRHFGKLFGKLNKRKKMPHRP